jgi:hypothetical protein
LPLRKGRSREGRGVAKVGKRPEPEELAAPEQAEWEAALVRLKAAESQLELADLCL